MKNQEFSNLHLLNENVSMTLIANTGVLVEYDGIKILVDGIHYDSEYHFSKVPKKILNDMMEGNGKFKNIDYIMFSHEHSDHFSPYYTMEYLKNNNVKCIFMPLEGSEKLANLQAYINNYSFSCRLLKLPVGESCCYQLRQDISVTIFNAVHMGKQYSFMDNYCFLLTLGEKNILFTADADYVDSYFKNPLTGKDIDVVFVNPLFFNNIAGRKVIENVIKPTMVGVYHIPFLQDDKLMFRKIVKRDMNKFKNDFYDVFALCDEGQTVII